MAVWLVHGHGHAMARQLNHLARMNADKARRLDDDFLDSYGRACDSMCEQVPVVVVLGDALVVYRRGERLQLGFGTERFHLLKTVAHAPVALVALLHPTQGAPIDNSLRHRMHSLRARVVDVRASCRDTEHALVVVLDQTTRLIDETLATGKTDRARLGSFARQLAPTLQALVERATALQLQALHAAVDKLLLQWTQPERSRLQVVVTGDHQARVRSLGMQYFQKRFREVAGADGRVTYAEGVSDPDEAFSLVAKRRLDVVLAAAFFGDPKRLQRDVLGDAARDALAGLELPLIE